jgi:hypothetical protein
MDSLLQLKPKRRRLAFTRAELARMYWRAVSNARRLRPRDAHTQALIAYLEREFRATWRE